MLGKRDCQDSFGDLESARRVSDKNFLMRIDKEIDWKPFEQRLSGVFHPTKGRPSHPPLLLFKALLLQQWYKLSDPGLEEALRDRISFQKFCGLSFSSEVPDETTICRFRGRLAKDGLGEELFGILNEQLEGKGLIIKRGTLIDATLIEADRKRPIKGNSSAGDPDAAYALRGKNIHYGYKAHLAVDHGSELIRGVEITPANVHDSAMFVRMICGDEKAIFADKAYYKESRKRTLRKYQLYCGILDKATRGNPLSNKQKRRNRRFSAVRHAVERIPAILKRHYKLFRVRYVGLLRNRAHFFLLAMAMNMKRMLNITPITP